MSYRGFETLLTCVMIYSTCWTIFITTVNTEWICPEVWHHEQAHVVHQMDVHQGEREHF